MVPSIEPVRDLARRTPKATNRGCDIRLVVLSDYPGLGEFYNRAWFEDALATVQLPPGS